jgi:glycine/D-amino acid oxidase-like deaminating enzyme
MVAVHATRPSSLGFKSKLGTKEGLSAEKLSALPPFALYQLTMHCRDRGHPIAKAARADLQKAGLMDREGVVSEAARSFVLANVKGHGLAMEVPSARRATEPTGTAQRTAERSPRIGAGVQGSKHALEAEWMDRVRRAAIERKPEVVAGELVDMARIMSGSGGKFDAAEMRKWAAAAHTLTDDHGRVTPELQATIDKVEEKYSASFSKSAKLVFQDMVATAGGKQSGKIEMPLKRTPYWIKGVHSLANFQSTPELPKEADVVIIGAGLTGASAAYHIAKEAKRQGKSVVVLDAYDPGTAASGRNGGNFETLGEQFWGKYGTYDGVVAERYKFLKQAYPDQPDDVLLGQAVRIAEVLTKFALKNARRMLKTIEEGKIDCDVSRTGWLRTAMNEREEKGLLAQAALAKRLGAKIEVLSGEEIEKRYNLPTKYIGHVIYDNGNYHPFKLVNGELKSAISRGVKLYTRTKVEKIDSKNPQKHEIKTDRGTITAKRVVVATNAFTSEVFPELSDIKYKRSQVLTMEHVKNDLGGITYTAKDGDIYANCPQQDEYVDQSGEKRGMLLVGGGLDTLATNPHKPVPKREIFDMSRNEVLENHPDTKAQPPSRVWAGPMAFVEGERGMRMPVIGPLGEGARSGVMIAVFCNGYGGGGCHNLGANAAKWALTGKIPKELAQDVFTPARLFSEEPQFDVKKAAARGRKARAAETNFHPDLLK